MNKNNYDIHELTTIIAKRSSCNVKVGAVLFDKHGIFAWGWNSSGRTGYGQCAEQHAIERANRSRLVGASIHIVSLRKGKEICSIPCLNCMPILSKAKVSYAFCRGTLGHKIQFYIPRFAGTLICDGSGVDTWIEAK